ncbi:MAG: leucine-rich repeat domain-containing protein [Firmicutes bacterium]|nr:leucine-rich repeat domain-containing protein [Bacillota bacterium]
MTKLGKRLAAVFLALAMVITFMPALGTQTAYAETVLDSGTTGDCSWYIYTDDSDRYILEIIGNGNGKMADYTYNSATQGCTAPWDSRYDIIDEIRFDNVTEVGDYSFYKFTKLSRIGIDGVQRIGDHAFYGCTKVSYINIKGDKDKGCTIEESAFEDSMEWETDQESADLISLSNVTSIGDDAFNECDARRVYLGSSVRSIGYGAFRLNRWLSYVDIPKSCTDIGDYAFNTCPELEDAYILNDDCTLKKDSFDKSTKLHARKDSATLERVRSLGFDMMTFGDHGELVLDLSSKDYSGSVFGEDDEATKLYFTFEKYSRDYSMHPHDNSFGSIKSEDDGARRYIDLNKDGEYDIFVENDYEHDIISVKKIVESNLGGTFTFRLSEAAIHDEEALHNRYYSLFTIKMGIAKVAVPSGKSLTYNGKAQTGVAADRNYTVKGNIATKAGTYEATLSLKDKINYTWSDGSTADKKVKWTINKAANPLKISSKTATVKYSKLKKKAQTLAVTKVISFTKDAKDKKTYTLSSAKKGKKSFKKYFKINKTTGKVTVKKGLKKGTYKVKVKVKGLGNSNYKASAVKTVTFKVKVK